MAYVSAKRFTSREGQREVVRNPSQERRVFASMMTGETMNRSEALTAAQSQLRCTPIQCSRWPGLLPYKTTP